MDAKKKSRSALIDFIHFLSQSSLEKALQLLFPELARIYARQALQPSFTFIA